MYSEPKASGFRVGSKLSLGLRGGTQRTRRGARNPGTLSGHMYVRTYI